MSFPPITVHFMITYTLYNPLHWTGNQRDHWNFYLRSLSRFITFCVWWDHMPRCQLLQRPVGGTLSTNLYDKRDDFNFRIVNLSYICSNIPDYVVYISQPIIYARACSSYGDFIDRWRCYSLKRLLIKIILQHYNTPPWFNGRCVATSGEVYSSYRHLFTHLGFPSVRVVLSDIFSRLCHVYGPMIFDERMTDGYFLPYTFSCLWTNDFWLTDAGRLFPSLYFLVIDIFCTYRCHDWFYATFVFRKIAKSTTMKS